MASASTPALLVIMEVYVYLVHRQGPIIRECVHVIRNTMTMVLHFSVNLATTLAMNVPILLNAWCVQAAILDSITLTPNIALAWSDTTNKIQSSCV